MAMELYILFAAVVLGLVHVSADSFSFKAQVGNEYTVGPRDEEIQREKVAGRLHRAARNYTENLVMFGCMVFLLHAADELGRLSLIGAWMWIAGRVAYLFAYASGIPWVRTICWQVAAVGLVLLMIELFV